MRTLLCLLALTGMPVALCAQKPATVTVTAQGSFRTAPDTAVVSMDVTGQSHDLKAAYAQAQSQAAAVRSLLRQQGFRPEQAHWSGLQVQPNVDYKTHQVTSFTVRNDLELDFTNFVRIGPLLNAAPGHGLTALRSITFVLKHPEKAKAAAIADGFNHARDEATVLAQAAGLPLVALQSVTVDTSSISPRPMPRFMAMAAVAGARAPTAQFTPQEINVTANITAVFTLRH
ncbi:MAG: SIMPL domain-containing protein [Terriglobales bacterium]